MNLTVTRQRRFIKLWQLLLVGVVAGGLMLGATAGTATVTPP